MVVEHTPRQEGAATPEFVGVVVIVAAVVGALMALALWTTLGDWGEYAVCSLFGDECERPGHGDGDGDDADAELADAGDRQPPVCTVSTDQQGVREHQDRWASRTIDGSRSAVHEMGDGSLVIMDGTYDGEGDQLGFGVQIPVGRSPIGLSMHGAREGTDESGVLYILDPEAREAYEATMAEIGDIEDLDLQSRARETYKNGGIPGELADFLRDDPQSTEERIQRKAMLDRYLHDLRRDHATHVYERSEDLVSFSLSGSYKLIEGGAAGSASNAHTVATHIETGDQLITMDLSAEMAAHLGVGKGGAGTGVGGGGLTDASLTLDVAADGTARSVSLTLGAEVTGGTYWGLGGDAIPAISPEALRGWGVDLPAGGLVTHTGGGGRGEVTFNVPLDGAEPGLLDGVMAGSTDDFAAFAERAFTEGDVLVETYEVNEGTRTQQAGLHFIVGRGSGTETVQRSLGLVSAVSYDPVNGPQTRGDCRG